LVSSTSFINALANAVRVTQAGIASVAAAMFVEGFDDAA